jgi:hypothetical protein
LTEVLDLLTEAYTVLQEGSSLSGRNFLFSLDIDVEISPEIYISIYPQISRKNSLQMFDVLLKNRNLISWGVLKRAW